MKFSSQIATSIAQSNRLLELGLKKETADAFYLRYTDRDEDNPYVLIAQKYDEVFESINTVVPAWSLHRIIDMLPSSIIGLVMTSEGESVDLTCYLRIKQNEVSYQYYDTDYSWDYYEVFYGKMYDNVINMIEFLINDKHFDKKYLVDTK